jgi:signal transduction histidine kinase
MNPVALRDVRWLAPAAVAVLAGAVWMRTWSGIALAASAASLVAFVVLGWAGRRRMAFGAFVLGLGAFQVAGWVTRSRLKAFSAAPLDYQRRLDARASDELRRALRASTVDLAPAAQRALAISSVSPGRFEDVARTLPVASYGEVAAVLMDSLGLYAWAGTVRVSPRRGDLGTAGILRNEFYLVAYATAQRGERRAVVMRTLHALPPADRLARDVASIVARQVGVDRFDIIARDAPLPSAVSEVVDAVGVALVASLPSAGALRVRLEDSGRGLAGLLLGFSLLVGLGFAWRRPAPASQRSAALLVALATLVLVPLNALSNVTWLFDPTFFFAPIGGPFTASVGALSLTSALALIGLFTLLRRSTWIRSRILATLVAVVCVTLGPYLVRDLARGITLPPRGVGATLWTAWEIGIFLPATVLLLLAVVAGQAARRSSRGLPPGLGTGLAAAVAIAAPVVWEAPGRFPSWYVGAWSLAMALTVFARRTRTTVFHAALVAACGATTVVWANVTRGRVQLADRDVAGLATADQETQRLLERLLTRLEAGPVPSSRADLLKLYQGTDLASAGNPVELALWDVGGTRPRAELVIADLRRRAEGERALVREADSLGVAILREFGSSQGVQLVLAAPLDSARVLTAVAAPRTRLIGEDPFAALLGLEAPSIVEPPYRIEVHAATRPGGDGSTPRWTRRGDELHGEWELEAVLGSLRALVEVELRSLEALIPRGALLLLADLAVLALLWLLAAASDGALRRWIQIRASRWGRSYRARLTVAIFAAFVLPAVAFALWTYRRLQDEDLLSRSLLVQETLRAVGAPDSIGSLADVGARLSTPLLLYRGGELVETSDELLRQLAPLGVLIDATSGLDVAMANEQTATGRLTVGGVPTLLGYRALPNGTVLAAPARRSELELERQQRDLVYLLSIALAVGALVALWLSGLAARAFARPIGELRRAAEEVAAGARTLTSLGPNPASEFQPVFGAFRTMASDLADSREDLARAQRVFAWGEMARQVAHEIKNPLTPIRLGVQHLRRAHQDRRPDFDRILEQNVDRILGEIDRLDEISRSFAKFGTHPEAEGGAGTGVPVEVVGIARDVIDLERMGEGQIVWRQTGLEQTWALSRDGELREVLLNLLENARQANARTIEVRVTRDEAGVVLCVDDDGDGIPEEVLPNVFEPRFSTRTSGSGLGLSISKRMVESWGGRIRLMRRPGGGTRAEVELVAADPI